MEIPNRLVVALALLGLLIALALWGFGLVPWWAVPIIVVAAPFLLFAVLMLAFYALWMASGSH